MADWFYVDNGAQAGPVSAAELQQKAAAGAITPDTLVWKEGMAEWTAISAVPELQSTAAPGSPAPVTGIAPADPARDPAPAPVSEPAASPSPAAMSPMASDSPATTPEPTGAPVDPSQAGKIDLGGALGKGWELFMKNPVGLSIITLVLLLVTLGMVIVGGILNVVSFGLLSPIVGLAMVFVMGYLAVGAANVAVMVADGKEVTYKDLFLSSKYYVMPGVANLIISLIGGVAVGIVLVPIFGAAIFGAAAGGGAASAGAGDQVSGIMGLIFGVGGLVALLLLLVIGLAMTLFYLWPALVADRDEPPIGSIFTSFKMLMPSAVMWIILAIVMQVILWIGSLLLGVGVIPASALCLCIYGVAYRQIVPKSA